MYRHIYFIKQQNVLSIFFFGWALSCTLPNLPTSLQYNFVGFFSVRFFVSSRCIINVWAPTILISIFSVYSYIFSRSNTINKPFFRNISMCVCVCVYHIRVCVWVFRIRELSSFFIVNVYGNIKQNEMEIIVSSHSHGIFHSGKQFVGKNGILW